MDLSSDSQDDECLFAIPDTPSPIFSSRKRKVKVNIALPNIIPHPHENYGECETDSPQSADLATRNSQTGRKEVSRLMHSGVDIMDWRTAVTRPFPVTEERHAANENPATCDLYMNGVTSPVSPTIDLTHGRVRLERAPSKDSEFSPPKLNTRRSRENGRTSGICGGVDGFHEEENDDFCILSPVISGGGFCADIPFDRPVRSHDMSHNRCAPPAPASSPRKRRFQNGASIMDPYETDAVCNGRVSHFASSLNSPTSHQQSSGKPKSNGERSTHRKDRRWTERVPSPRRHVHRTTAAPSSTRSTIMSPSSRSHLNAWLRRKHHRRMSNHRRQKLNSARTSSTSADRDSVCVTDSDAMGLPRGHELPTSSDTAGVAGPPGFVPAGSLIDLTESPEPTFATGSMDWHLATRIHEHPATRRPSRRKRNSSGGDANMARIMGQMEQDEVVARRLQEEMDLEFAMALAESDIQGAANSAMSSSGLDLASAMCSSTVIDSGPVQIRARGARVHVNVWNEETVASVRFATHVVPNVRQGRGGGRGRRARQNAPEVNDGNDYEFLLRLSEHIGDARTAGLCRHEIDLLPLRIYSGLQAGRDASCNICMCDYESGDNLRMLPCFHEFHQACIDQWIQKNATCPICREDIEIGQN